MVILRRVLVIALAAYLAWFAIVFVAMRQSPRRFGAFMRHTPPILVWALLPAQHMWLSARAGNLSLGSTAPDFSLPALHEQRSVTLSSFRGKQPVVLIFGSYT